MRTILVSLGILTLAVAAPHALADRCVDAAGAAAACAVVYDDFNRHYEASVTAADGSRVAVTFDEGTGYFGQYLYLIAWTDAPAADSWAYAGVGFRDSWPADGQYDAGCVCGDVWAAGVFVPVSVGYWDADGDGTPDTVYAVPILS